MLELIIKRIIYFNLITQAYLNQFPKQILYLDATMNQGLKFLAIQAEKQGIKLKDLSKVVIIPFHGFIDELISLMRRYCSKPISESWGQYIALCSSDKQFSNIYGSWLKYNITSLQTKLISTLLLSNSVSKMNSFLKLRKLILKTDFTTKTLDSLSLQHSDIIGIVHSAYSMPEIRKKILEGVKSLFISFRIQQAKIQSTVFIEYALSFHEDIRQKQVTEATIAQQKMNYGSIPESILVYSSIQSKNMEKNRDSQNVSNNDMANNNKSNNNTSQYISNFHSVIHEQNGLHRKIKSSQISLQGYKIIDHKFQNNFLDMNNKSLMKNENKMSKSPLGSKYNDQKQRKQKKRHFTQHNDNYTNQNEQKIIYKTKQSARTQNDRTPQKMEKKTSFANRENTIGNSKLQQKRESDKKQGIMFTESRQSKTYSQKFKSPDISYELTPGGYSNLKEAESNTKGGYKKNQRGIESKVIKPIEIEQQQSVQKYDPSRIREKEGGYDMWKKLKERNHVFIAKMLKSHELSRVRHEKAQDDQIPPQQINVIHDSIVRHFGVDKRAEETQQSRIVVDSMKKSSLK